MFEIDLGKLKYFPKDFEVWWNSELDSCLYGCEWSEISSPTIKTVFVDKIKYEAAIFNILNEIIPNIKYVSKDSVKNVILLQNNIGSWVEITLDPRPWEKEYFIEL